MTDATKPAIKPANTAAKIPTKPEDVLAELAAIVEEVAGVDAAEVTESKSFQDDLDIDSLSMVEIAVQAEDKFGVKIPDDELANLKTVGDAVNFIVTKLK